MSTTRKIFIFIGPPGSGKGSLADMCVKQLGWKQLSTGNLCRKHIAERTDIGKQIDLIIKSGKLISDELVTSMADEWLAEQGTDKPVILDGYPRTVEQARLLDKLLKLKFAGSETIVVVFDIDDEVVIKRMSARLVCTNKNCQSVFSMLADSPLSPRVSMVCDRCQSRLERRADDDPEVIRRRLVTYHQHVLLPHYELSGARVVHINAEQPLDAAFADFLHCVGMSAS